VGFDAKSAIRVQAVQVKEEMEEPKEGAVNKREGSSELESMYVVMKENESRSYGALKMSDESMTRDEHYR
jgi:hypothetical protein